LGGNPFTHQRDLMLGEAVVVFRERGVVALTGPDRLSYLDSLVSQDVSRLMPGESAEALLLDPQGHVERAMGIIDDGETTWLLVDEDQAAPLAAFLDRMTFSKDAEARDASGEFYRVGFFPGGSAETALSAVIENRNGVGLVWADPWNQVAPGGWQYASAEGHPAPAWNYREAFVADSIEPASFGPVPTVEASNWEALRVAAWRPRFATEVDANSLPHEYDWLRSAVHLNKGCYRGQETVAKVHNLGHPPRRLTLLHLDGSTNILPTEGAEIALGGVGVGHVTVAANHFEDGPIALALLKRSVPADATLIIETPEGSISASQQVVVPADAGRTVDVPRMPRLGVVSRDG
jgi:folate-binding protein YgfZ